MFIVVVQGGPAGEVDRLLIMVGESMEQLKLCGRDMQQMRIPNDVFRR